jgi:hypothetical protein
MDRYAFRRTEGGWLDECDGAPLELKTLKHTINACHLFVAVQRQALQANIEYGGSVATGRERNRIAQDIGTPEYR